MKLFFLLFIIVFYIPVRSNVQPPILITPESAPQKETPIDFPIIKNNKAKKPKKKIFIRWGAKSLNWSKQTEQNKNINFILNFGWIQHQRVLLKANKIQIIGRNVKKAILRGAIKVEDKKNKILLRAGLGVYEKEKEQIEIKREPRFYSFNSKNHFSVSSKKIMRNFQKKQTWFEKDINFSGKDFTIICDKATLDEEESKLTTDNFPYFFLSKSFLTGKNFTYWNKEKKAILENEVSGFFLSFEKPSNFLNENEQNEEQRIVAHLTANKMISQRFDDSEKNFIQITGNAVFEKNEISFQSKELFIYGNDASRIETSKYIEIIDKKNQIKLSGNKLEYMKDQSYIHITKDSKIDFFDKNDETKIQSTIYAAEIERFLDKRETVLKGNLQVESKDTSIQGEYATYYDDDEKMIIYGNPVFTRNNMTMKVGEVIFYPKEQRVVLSNELYLK